jgi:hypothetical protein
MAAVLMLNLLRASAGLSVRALSTSDDKRQTETSVADLHHKSIA